MSTSGWFTEPLAAGDLPEVMAIETDCFPNPWPPEGFLHGEKASWARSRVLRSARAPGRVCGYICYWMLEGEMEIQNIAVHRDHRREGGAWELMKSALEEAAGQGCDTAWLEVRPSNRGAIALYERWGFRPAGRRRRYYEDGEDALVMQACLEGSSSGETAGSDGISLKGPRSGC